MFETFFCEVLEYQYSTARALGVKMLQVCLEFGTQSCKTITLGEVRHMGCPTVSFSEPRLLSQFVHPSDFSAALQNSQLEPSTPSDPQRAWRDQQPKKCLDVLLHLRLPN